MSHRLSLWRPRGAHLARRRLSEIDRVALEVRERAVFERALMGRTQDDAWGAPSLERFLPARRAEAPAVAGLQAREAEFRHRRREIVAAGLRKFQKLRRHHRADG